MNIQNIKNIYEFKINSSFSGRKIRKVNCCITDCVPLPHQRFYQLCNPSETCGNSRSCDTAILGAKFPFSFNNQSPWISQNWFKRAQLAIKYETWESLPYNHIIHTMRGTVSINMQRPSNKTYSKHTPNHAPSNERSNWCQSSELGSAKRFNSELQWRQAKWNDSDRSITNRLIVISARELFESSEENLTESSTLCAETLNKQDQDWKETLPIVMRLSTGKKFPKRNRNK